MPRPTQALVVKSFLGLNSATSTEIDSRELSVVQNLYPEGAAAVCDYYVSRGGSYPRSETLSPDSDLQGLEAFTLGTTGFLIGVHNGNVRNILTDAVLARGSSRFGAGDVNGVFLYDRLILGDGVNPNVAVTGATCLTLMSEQPPVGAVTVTDTGAGGLPSGSYSYRLTFNNFEGAESEPSAATASVTIGNNRSILISPIPQPSDPDATAINLYARGPNDTTWKRAATLAVGVLLHIHTTPATGVTIRSTSVGALTRMPPCRYFDVKDDRLWSAYSLSPSGDTRTVYASKQGEYGISPLLPDESDATDGYRFEFADTISGLKTHGATMAVFTAGKGYLIFGDKPSLYAITEFSPTVGCISHRSIKSLGGQVLIWLSDLGVYTFNGSSVDRISDKIRDTLAAIPTSGLVRAEAEVWDDRYYLFLPALTLVYDFRFGQWVTLTNVESTVAAVLPYTSVAAKRFFAARRGSSRVWELETGTTDAESPIPTILQTAAWDMDAPYREKRLLYLEAAWKKLTTGTATIKLYRATGNLIQTLTHDLSSTAYSGQAITRMVKAAVGAARDEFFSLRVEADVSEEYRLLQLGCHYKGVK